MQSSRFLSSCSTQNSSSERCSSTTSQRTPLSSSSVGSDIDRSVDLNGTALDAIDPLRPRFDVGPAYDDPPVLPQRDARLPAAKDDLFFAFQHDALSVHQRLDRGCV